MPCGWQCCQDASSAARAAGSQRRQQVQGSGHVETTKSLQLASSRRLRQHTWVQQRKTHRLRHGPAPPRGFRFRPYVAAGLPSQPCGYSLHLMAATRRVQHLRRLRFLLLAGAHAWPPFRNSCGIRSASSLPLAMLSQWRQGLSPARRLCIRRLQVIMGSKGMWAVPPGPESPVKGVQPS